MSEMVLKNKRIYSLEQADKTKHLKKKLVLTFPLFIQKLEKVNSNCHKDVANTLCNNFKSKMVYSLNTVTFTWTLYVNSK